MDNKTRHLLMIMADWVAHSPARGKMDKAPIEEDYLLVSYGWEDTTEPLPSILRLEVESVGTRTLLAGTSTTANAALKRHRSCELVHNQSLDRSCIIFVVIFATPLAILNSLVLVNALCFVSNP